MDETIHTAIGKLTAKLEAIHEDTSEMKKDIKDLCGFKNTTEERLRNGNKKFEIIEKRVYVLEERKPPKASLVYAILTLGLAFVAVVAAMAGK